MKEEINYLEPQYSSAKSFYKKAYVKETKKEILLYSYDTLVVIYNKESEKYTLPVGTYSKTTTRHIKEFLIQYTIYDNLSTKKEIEENKTE